MQRPSAFEAAPQSGKLAVDGVWEEASAFHPGEPAAEDQVRLLLGRGADVACEAFFGQAFFGVRRRGPTADLVAFVRSFTEVLQSAASGADFFAAVVDELAIPLQERFRYAELGAEGAWRSVGPLRIEHPQSALADPGRLWADVQGSSVWRDVEHEKALEFSYDNGDGTTHWLALPVSRDRRIVRAKVEAALRAFVDGRLR